jgi:FAD/FMN-containing dehydrogenase/Fe-S oxidoreductase
VVPAVVAFPRTDDDVAAAVEMCREEGVALTVRGGGTSVAGNAVGPGVVLDLSRHRNRVLGVDPDRRRAIVEPGVVLDDLQRAARPHGLRFGPDPSTHSRCTIGGMIGNNACGAHAMAWGTTAANVVALDVIDGSGRRSQLGPGGSTVPGLRRFVDERVSPIAGQLGRFGRQVSGYSLQHLLTDDPSGVARALVGTEGTCVVVLGAEVALVPLPPARALAVLAYPDMATAADAVPALAEIGPLALEGIDARIVEVVRSHKGGAVPELPAGGAWLFAEIGGPTPDAATADARRLVAVSGAAGSLVVPDGPAAAALWRIREDGAGLASRTAEGAPAWPAWEDAAVPPGSLGAYLRDFEALLAGHHLDGLLYGHFGDGCIHVRIDLPLAEHPERLRPFLLDAAGLVASYGGSLSGEHGDGRARSELLGAMYTREALAAFAGFKALFDPAGLLNPGVIVDPAPVDADLRRPGAAPLRIRGGFALHADGGDFTAAVHRCVGVGKCRADSSAAGGFMCPSYLATGDEKDSTRGRARVLQELANGTVVTGGFAAAEVHDALDLCLACKACARDCPVSVDMATYKAQVLHQTYRRRIRPRSHYALGWLPRWLRVLRALPGGPAAYNRVTRNAAVTRLAASAAGIDPRRRLPALAAPAGRAAAHRPAARPGATGGTRAVVWVDTFTAAFSPAVADAAAAVLAAAGYRVEILDRPDACCGLTWITTGQLDAARGRLRRLLDRLEPLLGSDPDTVVVGLEPSCTATLRSDLVELLPADPRATRLAAGVRTLAEAVLARDLGWAEGRLAGRTVIAQPHCHHHAVMGYDADLAVLRAAGAEVTTLAGCCGLAGNFGMEQGHYEVSVAVAERTLLPALRAAPEGAVLLADGFSCRTQADQLAGWPAATLAELLAEAARASRPAAGTAAARPQPSG